YAPTRPPTTNNTTSAATIKIFAVTPVDAPPCAGSCRITGTCPCAGMSSRGRSAPGMEGRDERVSSRADKFPAWYSCCESSVASGAELNPKLLPQSKSSPGPLTGSAPENECTSNGPDIDPCTTDCPAASSEVN